MKTTKLFLCIIAIVMSFSSASAQQAMTTTDSLMAYKWVSQRDYSGSEVKEHYSIFEIDRRKVISIFDTKHEDYDPEVGPSYEITTPYYVSATKDTSFKESEVGKRKNGKFIIVKEKNDVGVYEILWLSNAKLALRYWQSDIYSSISIWLAQPK